MLLVPLAVLEVGCTDFFPATLTAVVGVACFLCSIFFNVAEESILVDTGSSGAVAALVNGCLR